jgi:hypothetical protein
MYPFWNPQPLLGGVPSGPIEHEQDTFSLSHSRRSYFPGAKCSKANENACAPTLERINQWTSPVFGCAKA